MDTLAVAPDLSAADRAAAADHLPAATTLPPGNVAPGNVAPVNATPVNVTPVNVSYLGAADLDPTGHHRTRPGSDTANPAANSGSPTARAE
jgi:hypothetical protein